MATKKTSGDAGFVFPKPSKEEKVVVCFKQEASLRVSGVEVASAEGKDVSAIQDVLGKYPEVTIARTFAETEEELDLQTANLASATGTQMPTLSGFYHISTKDARQANAVVAGLAKSELVEEVYIEPSTVPALYDPQEEVSAADLPPATPDFANLQKYLNPATDGVDAKYAWAQAGGRGQGIKVIDIEGAWNFSHEDLLLNQGGVVGGTPTGSLLWLNHGTAVQGEISGDRNGRGVLGIADAANF